MSPAAQPGFHKGRSPKNKGRKLPAEVLTTEEVDELLNAGAARGVAFDSRDRAMIWLMYRAGLKINELVSLYPRHYHPHEGRLDLPGRRRGSVELDARARDLLDDWMEKRRSVKGITKVTPLFCGLLGKAAGNDLAPTNVREMLNVRADRVGITRRVTPEGLRKSGAAHAGGSTGIGALFDEQRFAARYPTAYQRWRDGQALFNINPDRYAGNIGLACREAMIAFAATFSERFGVSVDAPPQQTVVRVRRVVTENEHRMSEKVAALSQDVLVPYWGTVSDLVQRQVHGAEREREPLTRDDAARVLMQTFMVMYELDRSVPDP
jgi:hypothetical protein